MKLRNLFWALGVLLIVLSCLWLFRGGNRNLFADVSTNTDSVKNSQLSQSINLSKNNPTFNATISERMKERDFNTLKVDLPEPEDKPWSGPFWNSSNFRSPETAKVALEVLPIWIRKGVLDGNKDQVGKYLFSLLSYLDDKDPDTRIEAALLLYKLGSRDAKMLSVLKDGIKFSGSKTVRSSFSDWGTGISRRTEILEHLRFYSDNALDDYVEAVFQQFEAIGNSTQETHELAMYLEAAGRPRPDSFWLERLESSSDMVDAINVLRKRQSVDVVEILKSKIDATPNSTTSLTATALLYGITGNPAYEPLLTEVVDEAVKSGSPVAGLEIALEELLKGNSPQAATAVKRVLASENQVLQEKALAALGRVPESISIQMIKEYATPIIDKNLIPNAAFRALIEMSTEQSDEAYETLKHSVLAHDSRSEVDFDALEFAKKHRNQIN